MKTALRIAQCQLAFSPKAVHVQISIHHRIHNGTTMKSYQPLRFFILYAIGTCASSILTRLIRKPQLEKRAETSIERLTVKGCRTRESDHFQRQQKQGYSGFRLPEKQAFSRGQAAYTIQQSFGRMIPGHIPVVMTQRNQGLFIRKHNTQILRMINNSG